MVEGGLARGDHGEARLDQLLAARGLAPVARRLLAQPAGSLLGVRLEVRVVGAPLVSPARVLIRVRVRVRVS